MLEDGKFKVCKKTEPNKCFSKKGLTLEIAKKQMRAIGMNEHKGGTQPKDKDLYNEIKEQIYKEQPKHSLYRSARIQKEYQERGGTYEDEPLPEMNIKKWFNQNWISLNDYLRDKTVPCGSTDTEKLYNEYPLCRAEAIAEKLTKPQIKLMIKEKNKLKNKPLKTETIIKSKRLNIKPTLTGLGKKKLKPLPKKLLLLIVQKVAKERNYDPKSLKLSKDKIHKLEYHDGKKWVKFGREGYNDFPTYLYNYTLGNITKEEAYNKMRNYRKRATKVMQKTKNKYSPASLSYYLLW
ncbi:MAG TPA: DUF5872 domain-containing protein [Allocoleopsis sp.]